MSFPERPVESKSDSFRARLERFRYTSSARSEQTSLNMSPRTRSGGLKAPTKAVTDTEEQEASSLSDSEVPTSTGSNPTFMRTPQSEPNSTKKRKQDARHVERLTPKKPRLQKTATVKPIPAENNLKDSLREGLILVSVGLNPGIMTGKLGHAYSHPTNRYWPTLHGSGITPIQHKPEDTHQLMDLYGLGHTNIITTIASVGAKDLTTQDYMDGAAILEAKVRKFRPQAVAVVGKGIWEEWVRYKTGRKFNQKKNGFEYGWQDPDLWVGKEDGGWEGARTFVVTTTSGASTAHTKEQRIAIWKPLGDWFTPQREEWVKQRQQQDSE